MKRQIIFKGGSTILSPGGYLFPGTSGYPDSNTPTKTLYDTWNNETPVAGEHTGTVSNIMIAMGMVLPPTLIVVEKMLIESGFDYAQMGSNGWWFPPDNAAGPGAAIVIRKRDLTTWHIGTGAAAYVMQAGDPYNVNINQDPALYRLYSLSWELLDHPEGGIITSDDLRDWGVGVNLTVSNGPNGLPYDPASRGFFRVRVPFVKVTLDVDDLGGDVASMRASSSLWLRMMSKPRNTINPVLLEHNCPASVGEVAHYSHPRGPSVGGYGWGERLLERRSGLVLKRVYSPGQGSHQDESFDLRPYVCLGNGVYRIDNPWSPELQGVMLVDKGRGFVHTRAQDAWSPRPGDGVLMRVIEAYPNVSFEGMAVSGGGDVELVLQNFDPMQAGWSTVGSAGNFAATADTTVSLVEERGYGSSCKLDYGAGNGAGGRLRSLGTLPRAAGDYVHMTVRVKNTSVPTPSTQFAEWYLLRSGGGLASPEYWDAVNRLWTTTPVYNAIPSSAPYGEAVSDAIPCNASGATSDPTYSIAVGRFSAQMGPVVIHAGVISVQHTDNTVVGGRPPLITLAAQLTRVADTHIMEHVWGRELWTHERGVAMFEGRPWWKSDLLPVGAVKPLLHAQHAANSHDALQFVDGNVRFERAISGETTYQLDCPVTTVLSRDHVLRAWVRYLGADGWTGYGPYSVEVGFLVTLASDGSFVERDSIVGRLTSETEIPYDRDFVGIGYDASRQFDGWVREWETRRNPLHAQEIERL